MSLTGSKLYLAAEQILDKKSTSLKDFVVDMGSALSKCVVEEMELVGAYAGLMPTTPPVPSTIVIAAGKLTPLGSPSLFLPFNPQEGFISWIKKSLEATLQWNIVSITPHTNVPTLFNPTLTMLDLWGWNSLEDIQTSYGFWAILCDAIACCILGYIPTKPNTATCIDGSSGNIVWTPVEIPEIKHNFVFRVHYDANNLALVQWINQRITDTGDLSGDVDVPLNDQPYLAALSAWKGLTAITDQCTFWKKQDDGKLILLASGS